MVACKWPHRARSDTFPRAVAPAKLAIVIASFRSRNLVRSAACFRVPFRTSRSRKTLENAKLVRPVLQLAKIFALFLLLYLPKHPAQLLSCQQVFSLRRTTTYRRICEIFIKASCWYCSKAGETVDVCCTVRASARIIEQDEEEHDVEGGTRKC